MIDHLPALFPDALITAEIMNVEQRPKDHLIVSGGGEFIDADIGDVIVPTRPLAFGHLLQSRLVKAITGQRQRLNVENKNIAIVDIITADIKHLCIPTPLGRLQQPSA